MSDNGNTDSHTLTHLTLHEVPYQWCWTKMGDIACFKNGINFSKGQKGDEGVPTIDVLNMYGAGVAVSLDNVYRVNKEIRPEQLLRDGDVLFVRSSVKREGVAWVSLFQKTDEPVSFCGFIIRARLESPSVLPRYLVYYLRSAKVRHFLVSRSSQVTITNINQNAVGSTPVPVAPSPEQHRIVKAIESYLTRLDDAVASLKRVQRNLKRYRASVLKAAVEGRLVPTEAELARSEGTDLPAPRPGQFFVYVLECDDASHYIDQTNDVLRRWEEHARGSGAEWTRRHPPVALIHWEAFASHEEAVNRERILKTGVGREWLKREIAAGRTRQAGYEPASVLLERILKERRHRWIEDAAKKGRAKAEEKSKKAGKTWTEEGNSKTLEAERAKAAKKYKEPDAPEMEGLPELPEGWCWAKVDMLADEVRYGSSAKCSASLNGGVPVLRMGNILDGRPVFDRLKFLPPKHEEFPDLLLERGDLLFNRTNSAELVGKSAIFKAYTLPCSFASYLIRVRFLVGVQPEYVAAFINSSAGRQWIASVVSQQVGQANVNGTKLKHCSVPLPPAAEQDRIIAEIERLDSVNEATAESASEDLERCVRLRQSILKWAFEGKLVDQNPDDEPASVLLERIRAARAAMEAANTKQKGRKAGLPGRRTQTGRRRKSK